MGAPHWLKELLPAWAQTAVEWLLTPGVLTWVGVGSAVLFVVSLIGLPWLVTRLPADYLIRDEPETGRAEQSRQSPLAIAVLIGRNVLGLSLLVAGAIMLVVPGQGLLTIVVGVILLKFPGKRWLERRLCRSPLIIRALNAIRKRAGRPPLELGFGAEPRN